MMTVLLRVTALGLCGLLLVPFACGQDAVPKKAAASEQSTAANEESAGAAEATAEPSGEDAAEGQPEELMTEAREKVEEIAEQVDQDEQAQEISAGILRPIYEFAEYLAFPAFHWLAFALMVTGVVSFALQLVLAKLVVLMKLGFSFTEILSDALGLVISLLGLVLTTQAAAENSSFTRSPAAVLSATAAGLIAGFIFYLWGQSQEIQAAKGRAQKR